MIPYSDESKEKATALFFYEQSVDGIKKAVSQFINLRFDENALITNARKFDKKVFCEGINNIINLNDQSHYCRP